VSLAARSHAASADARLLVVDDEPSIVDMLATRLRYAGFQVATASNGTEAVRLAKSLRPDLIVLDVLLPDVDGFEIVARLRSCGTHSPVVFTSDRDDTQDKIRGLTLGADDYLIKPFSLEEIVARIGAVLRRTRQAGARENRLKVADLVIDKQSHEVWRGGQQVALSPTEYELLHYLMVNAGRVVSKAQILDHVWNFDFNGEWNIVESYISHLRRKVDNVDPRLLHTRRGVGYVLKLPAQRSAEPHVHAQQPTERLVARCAAGAHGRQQPWRTRRLHTR
jgi:two-component system OmpR family response regulator